MFNCCKDRIKRNLVLECFQIVCILYLQDAHVIVEAWERRVLIALKINLWPLLSLIPWAAEVVKWDGVVMVNILIVEQQKGDATLLLKIRRGSVLRHPWLSHWNLVVSLSRDAKGNLSEFLLLSSFPFGLLWFIFYVWYFISTSMNQALGWAGWNQLGEGRI